MRILITGGDGQVGRALKVPLTHHEIVSVDKDDFDLTAPDASRELEARKPELVIHAAAMTNVDACANHPEKALEVNARATEAVARACARIGARMIYLSTNEVFDGKAEVPYAEDAEPNPINDYGRSKLAGEVAAARFVEHLAIVRTAWVFSHYGQFFPQKILARAEQLGELRVVDDEIGSPTFAPDLAGAISALVDSGETGIFHFVNEGWCSRHTFAREILNRAGRGDVPVLPITSDQFTRSSTPPPFSPLQNTRGAAIGIRLRPWTDALDAFFDED